METLSCDVPFETDEEMTLRLARYEEQFSSRYTEADDWYARTCQRTARWYQVPVMSPWPPKRPFGKKKRYDDLDSGPYRRGYYSDKRNRDRGHGYPSRDKYNQHEPHSYRGHSGWRYSSRSPRSGYYGSDGYGRQGRSPPPAVHHGSNWDRSHARHSPSASPSHESNSHTPYLSHTSLYPDHTHYDDHYPKQLPGKSRSRSKSPRSYTQLIESSPSENKRDVPPCYSEQQEGVSPGINQMEVQQMDDMLSRAEEHDVASSNTGPEEEISSQSETETSSVRANAPPPTPLDLSSMIASEDEQKLVPSQSDVMDILSVASKGSNEVTSENLRQVQRETQIQAARKTMKSRHKHEKTNLGKPGGKTMNKSRKGSHKETVSVCHGHAKNVSHSHLVDGGPSSKPMSKTHALLQESIEAAEKSSKTPTISTPTLDNSGMADIEAPKPTLVEAGQPRGGVEEQMETGARVVIAKKKRKRHKVVKRDFFSSSENEELDVVTPDRSSASLSVSLRRDLMPDAPRAMHEQQYHGDDENRQRRDSHGKIMLSAEDLTSDVSDAEKVVDTIEPNSSSDRASMWVRIDRDLVQTPSLPMAQQSSGLGQGETEHHYDSESLLESPGYAVELNSRKSTTMVIRAQPFPISDVGDCERMDRQGGTGLSIEDRRTSETGSVGMMSSGKKAKKKKKKKHKKITMGEDLKLKITL